MSTISCRTDAEQLSGECSANSCPAVLGSRFCLQHMHGGAQGGSVPLGASSLLHGQGRWSTCPKPPGLESAWSLGLSVPVS